MPSRLWLIWAASYQIWLAFEQFLLNRMASRLIEVPTIKKDQFESFRFRAFLIAFSNNNFFSNETGFSIISNGLPKFWKISNYFQLIRDPEVSNLKVFPVDSSSIQVQFRSLVPFDHRSIIFYPRQKKSLNYYRLTWNFQLLKPSIILQCFVWFNPFWWCSYGNIELTIATIQVWWFQYLPDVCGDTSQLWDEPTIRPIILLWNFRSGRRRSVDGRGEDAFLNDLMNPALERRGFPPVWIPSSNGLQTRRQIRSLLVGLFPYTWCNRSCITRRNPANERSTP